MKWVMISAVMVMLMTVNIVQADVWGLINGSFEDDGHIADITIQEPNGWDVNMPVGKLKGLVSNAWVTDGSYNLTLHSQSLMVYEANDTATVSQQINLTDANEIFFDLRLGNWNQNKISALMLIDEDEVWNSNDLGSDEYYDQAYAVGDKYRDGEIHTLSFGIRVEVSEQLWLSYFSNWDFIECTDFCDGNGLIAGDFNQDCYVDMDDFISIANLWRDELASYDRHNLYKGDDADPNGVINLFDLSLFAGNWLASSYD